MGWRTHGMSVEGYRHRREGLPCQDAWHQAVAESSRVTVLAVADGAGSRPYSDQGASLAVRLATAYFSERLSGNGLFAGRLIPGDPSSSAALVRDGRVARRLLADTLLEVRDAFLDRVAADGGDPHDYATTLTVVALTPGWVGHVSVGDGFVVLRAGGSAGQRLYHLLAQPEAASEYSNETVFLTSAQAPDWVRAECVVDPDVDGVFLSTDGLAQAAISWSGGQPASPNTSFATAVFRSLDHPGPDPARDDAALAELLRSDRLSALNADDKTLVRAVRP